MDISLSVTVVCNILPSLVDQDFFFFFLANKVYYARFSMVCKKLCLISFGEQDNKLNIRQQRNLCVTHQQTGKKHIVQHSKIPVKVQSMLWEQPFCANMKLILPKLSLCIGMPLMIQNNAAMELCITKGQEAFVHSWDSSHNSNGKWILETLFVELIDPPTMVTVGDLPQNVVPLMRTSVSTSCQLPDDTSITREWNGLWVQVQVRAF